MGLIMTKKYKLALQVERRSQQWVADKFDTSRQLVNMIIHNTNRSKGHFGKSKLIKDYLDDLVKKWEL